MLVQDPLRRAQSRAGFRVTRAAWLLAGALAAGALAAASTAAAAGAAPPLPPERPPGLTAPEPSPPAAAPDVSRPADLPQSADVPQPTDVPLPPARPPELGGPPAAGRAPGAPPVPAASEAGGCLDDLVKAGAKAEEAPPEANGTCGVAHPVRLTALPDGVTLKPAAVVNCAVARALVAYVGEDVAAAARTRLSTRLTAISVATSYDCRPRNHVAGAKMSEHGLGNAVDLSGFTFADGRTVTVGDARAGEAAAAFVADIRKASCARFTTVLGPGSDAEHGNHLHLDLRQRSNGYRICQ